MFSLVFCLHTDDLYTVRAHVLVRVPLLTAALLPAPPLCPCLTFIIASLLAQSPLARCGRIEICDTCFRADRRLPVIVGLGGMASSSGCLDSTQHVGRDILLRVNLID